MASDSPLRSIDERVDELAADLLLAAQIFVVGRTGGEGPTQTLDPIQRYEATIDGWSPLLPTEPEALDLLGAALAERFGDELGSCPRLTTLIGEPTRRWTASADRAAQTSVAFSLERIELSGGSTLFSDRDEADSLYVMTFGRLRVHRGATVLAEIGPGEIVGERALLTGEPRRGSVTATRDSVLYRLSREDFDRFCLSHPEVMRTMLTMLAQRVGDSDRRQSSGVVPSNLVVIPVGDDSPAHEFAASLVEYLRGHGSAALVTAATIDRSLGGGAANAEAGTAQDDRVRRRLIEMENENRHLVVIGTSRPTPWTQRLLRQADLILLVGRAGRPGPPNDTERWLADGHDVATAPCRLVLVEPSATRTPAGTRRWLPGREVAAVDHVHLRSRGHLGRFVRSLAGTPCALVLSGGASRGLAHIGVVRALAECGFPIDAVSGTSAGSLVGAALGMGWTSDEITERLTEVIVARGRRMIDLTVPYSSIIGGARFSAAMEELFGDTDIEDLWLTCLCLATDLTAAAGRTQRSGPVRTAVRASCSVPLLMPPVVADGHLLVDGALVNNIPVDPLLEVTDVGALVVVNVTEAFFTADEPYNYHDRLPFRRVLAGRFSPLGEPLIAPKLIDLLMRSLEIGSKSLEAEQFAKADLYVRPDVDRFGYTVAERIEEIAEAGYEATVSAIEEFGLPDVPFR